MGRGASVMVVLTLLASATNYGSNLIFSRVLSPASYGDLTALLALLVVLTVPTGAAQTVIAERVATHLSAGRMDRVRYLIRHALAHVGVVAIAVGMVYTLSIPFVVELLDLQAPGPAIALAPLVTLSFLLPVALGSLQGMDRYLALGLMLLAIALSRIAFGVPWASTARGRLGRRARRPGGRRRGRPRRRGLAAARRPDRPRAPAPRRPACGAGRTCARCRPASRSSPSR